MQIKLMALAAKYGSKILLALFLLLSLYAWDSHRLREAANAQHVKDMALTEKRNQAEARQSEALFNAKLEANTKNSREAIVAYAKIIEETSTPPVPLPTRIVRITAVANSESCGDTKANVPEGDTGGGGATREYELADGNRESLEHVQQKLRRLSKITLLLAKEIRETHTVD